MDKQHPDTVIARLTSAPARYTFKDIHDALFATVPGVRSIADYDEGICDLMRRKQGRRDPEISAKPVC